MLKSQTGSPGLSDVGHNLKFDFDFVLFQSQTGSPGLSDNTAFLIINGNLAVFQSQTGSSGLSTLAIPTRPSRRQIRFNPKRALLAFPTTHRVCHEREKVLVSIPQRAPQAIPTQTFETSSASVCIVSIPNRLDRPFRRQKRWRNHRAAHQFQPRPGSTGYLALIITFFVWNFIAFQPRPGSPGQLTWSRVRADVAPRHVSTPNGLHGPVSPQDHVDSCAKLLGVSIPNGPYSLSDVPAGIGQRAVTTRFNPHPGSPSQLAAALLI